MQHLQSNTTLQGGKYKIERVLGQGGFGITYLATQLSTMIITFKKATSGKAQDARGNAEGVLQKR